MTSRFSGGGDLFGMGSDPAVRRCPIPAPYQQRSRLDVGEIELTVGAGLPLPKRPLALLQQQQQQLLQPPAFVRSVRQKTILQGGSLSPVDLSSSVLFRPQGAAVAASTAGCSVPLRNRSYLFLQQQQQQQQQQQRQQGYNHPYLAANFSFPRPLPAVGEKPRPEIEPQNATVAIKNRLRELEKQLLDDDDDNNGGEEASASGSVVTAEWSEAMQNLLSPSSCSASSLSPSSTCSSSSSASSCRPPPSRQLLLGAASAIADGNIDSASATLDHLQKASAADPRGDPDQRLTAYMAAALHARITSLSSPAGASSFPAAGELCNAEHLRATWLLHESSPCFYLGFVAANLAILDATRGQPKIHIVDFDVGQGLQYAALVNALADRLPSSGRPAVRITAIADPTIPSNPQSGGGFLKWSASGSRGKRSTPAWGSASTCFTGGPSI